MGMAKPIHDVSDEEQLAKVRRSLKSEFRSVTPDDLDRVADTAYPGESQAAATSSTFLPILAEREARQTLRELQQARNPHARRGHAAQPPAACGTGLIPVPPGSAGQQWEKAASV